MSSPEMFWNCDPVMTSGRVKQQRWGCGREARAHGRWPVLLEVAGRMTDPSAWGGLVWGRGLWAIHFSGGSQERWSSRKPCAPASLSQGLAVLSWLPLGASFPHLKNGLVSPPCKLPRALEGSRGVTSDSFQGLHQGELWRTEQMWVPGSANCSPEWPGSVNEPCKLWSAVRRSL